MLRNDLYVPICADVLYGCELDSPPFPEKVFIELIGTATRSVEFNFNNKIYQQKDGFAMGSPLGPALANTFVGFREKHPFLIFGLVKARYIPFCKCALSHNKLVL